MKFGVYDHIDKSGAPLSQFYEDRLRLAEAYDRLGYRALHTAEHHATPLGMSPAASVFHSAVAQRTKRLRFGPLVYTLNLYHPLRLYEEICSSTRWAMAASRWAWGAAFRPSSCATSARIPSSVSRCMSRPSRC